MAACLAFALGFALTASCALGPAPSSEADTERLRSLIASGSMAEAEKLLGSAIEGNPSSSGIVASIGVASLFPEPGLRGRWMRSAAVVGARLYPRNPAVAEACAWAFLRCDSPASALAVLRASSVEGELASLYAEALMRADLQGRLDLILSFASSRSLASAGKELGDPILLIDASIVAKTEGDAVAASGFAMAALALDAGEGLPVELPELLLRDLGLGRFDLALAGTAIASDKSPATLELLAEAAMRTGKREGAKFLYRNLLDKAPLASWKAYANLAYLLGEGSESRGLLQAMIAAFPSSDGAILFYASYLASQGMRSEASDAIDRVGDAASARKARFKAFARDLSDAAARAEALALSEAFPDDPEAASLALCLLLDRFFIDDATVLIDRYDARGLDYPYDWLFRAMRDLARGDTGSAIAVMEAEGAAEDPALASFALGLVYLSVGDGKRAVERFEAALSSAGTDEERAKALKGVGRARTVLGDAAGAEAAFRAAISAWPDDPERPGRE